MKNTIASLVLLLVNQLLSVLYWPHLISDSLPNPPKLLDEIISHVVSYWTVKIFYSSPIEPGVFLLLKAIKRAIRLSKNLIALYFYNNSNNVAILLPQKMFKRQKPYFTGFFRSLMFRGKAHFNQRAKIACIFKVFCEPGRKITLKDFSFKVI